MSKELVVQSQELDVVAAQQALALAAQQAEELSALMEETAGEGFENVTAQDIAIPFFKLTQKGTPECEEGNLKFLKDAKPGMLLNNVTRELIDIRSTEQKFAIVVPVTYEKVIIEWRPNNGGRVAKHPMRQAMLDGAIKTTTPDGGIVLLNEAGNALEETAEYHVLLLNLETKSTHWGIMGLTGSKLGASRNWLSLTKNDKKRLQSGKQAALYSHMYRVSSVLETSKRTNKTYQNLRFEDHAKISDANMFKAALEYRDAILAGKVKAAPDGGEDPADLGHDLPDEKF